MLGPLFMSIGLIINRWWYPILMSLMLWYCIWLFANAVDAHLTTQLNLWSQNLGM